ncbi:hypothetical protein NE237_027209 [Protea cynaroides]|uniref:Pectinesterase inhibitor domain-containing protein n=1 Tax=Protea cynaroides TaxID=273540 RepID=A0A9Q0GM44_9MAGN|nr:hypothetical protein NE237_027209 [Protea cynaroides]
MACRVFTSFCFIPILTPFLVLFSFTSLADVSVSTPASRDSLCKSTPFPYCCRPLIHQTNLPIKSLASAKKFLGLVNKYLTGTSLSVMAIGALEDCQLLTKLNIDFLLDASKTVNSAKIFPTLQTQDQTCLDGLQATASAWSVKNGLSTPLSNSTKLYSVSLAIHLR